MPKIPVATSRVDVPGGARTPMLSAGALAAPGAALAGLGREIRQAGQTYHDVQEQRAVWDAQLALTKAEADVLQAVEVRKKNADPKAMDNFITEAMRSFDSFSDGLMESSGSQYGRAQALVQQQTSVLRNRVLADLTTFQTRVRSEQAVRDYTATENSWANQVFQNPALLQDAQGAMGALNATVPGASQEQRTALNTQTNYRLHNSALDGRVTDVERRPTTVAEIDTILTALHDGTLPYRDNMRAEDFEPLVKRLMARRDSAKTENRVSLARDFNDDIITIKTTGKDRRLVPDARIRDEFKDDPNQVARLLKEKEAAHQFYAFTQETSLTPIGADLARVDQARSGAQGVGAANQSEHAAVLGQVVTAKIRAVTEDPFQYVRQQNPSVRTTLDGAAKEFGSANTTEKRAAAAGKFQTGLDVSLAAQVTVTGNFDAARVLGKGAASQMAAVVNGSREPAEIGSFLEAQAQLYGPHWPRALRELKVAGMSSTVHTIARLDSPADSAARQELLTIVQAGGIQEIRKLRPETEVSDVRRYAADEMELVHKAFANTRAGLEIASAEQENVEALALLWTANKGMEPKAAAKAAYKALFGMYTFDDTGWFAPANIYDPVSRQVDNVLDGLRAEDLAPIAGAANTAAGQGEALRVLKSRGQWRNMPKSDEGLMLFMPAAGGWVPALDKNNKPIVYTFDALMGGALFADGAAPTVAP